MTTGIKALFFDIGGTLVTKANFSTRNLDVLGKMVELVQAVCTPAELEANILEGETKYKVWRSQSLVELPPVEKWSRFLLPNFDSEMIRHNADMLQALWSESRGEKKVPAETVTTLNELSRRGYLLGTISHTSPKYLESTGVLPLFKTIIHASKYGFRKPHPAPFLEAARQCGMLPEECAYVGDRPSRDVIGAREAGFGMVILLARSSHTAESQPCPMRPDITIHHLSALLKMFPKLFPGQSEARLKREEPLLFDAAVSSMWWNKETTSPDEFFSQGSKLGFARFELNHQIPPEVLKQINLDKYHIGSLHDPCPAYIPAKMLERADQVITSLDSSLREQAVEGVKATILESYNLGARHVVIHPGRIPGDHSLDDQLRTLYRAGQKGTTEYEELRLQVIADRAIRGRPHLSPLIASLQEIVAFAEGKGITLGLENRLHYYELPIFDELDALLTEFQQPWVGWHLDIGHLQVLTELGLTEDKVWLTKFGPRITGVHLHDVTGIVDHQAPGKGDLDFKRIASYLPPYCYRTLELDKSVSPEEVADSLKFLVKSGCINQLSKGVENA